MNKYFVDYLGNVYDDLMRVLKWDLAILADSPVENIREKCITVCNQVFSHYESEYLGLSGYEIF